MNKFEHLQNLLHSYGHVAIAYSGGCDSDFLLQTAIRTLGKDHVLAVFCYGVMISEEEYIHTCHLLEDIPHCCEKIDVLALPEFRMNQKNRCYVCKKTFMQTIRKIAKAHGFSYVLDGKNKDDETIYRPGNRACEELGILSPLAICNMTKEEVRSFSRLLHTQTFDKPANACLASRFPYNTLLTEERLQCVADAEKLLHEAGIHHVRVRVQDDTARIEMEKKDFSILFQHPHLTKAIKSLGFHYVVLDLEGIRSGVFDYETKKP